MKSLLLQRMLVAGGLSLGLVACGSAASPSNIEPSKEIVAAGPLGPPPPPEEKKPSDNVLPPDEMAAVASPDQGMPRKPIEKEIAEGGVDKDSGDPLGDYVFGGLSDSAAPPPPRAAITGQAKSGSHHGQGPRPPDSADPLGDSGSTGTTIGAASEVRASIDKEEIRRVVRAHLGDVKRCYEQGLKGRPDLEGKVVVKFSIGKAGTVVMAMVQETTVNDRPMEQCIVGAVKKWTFPKPAGEGIVTITYPFVFKTAG